MKDYPPMPPTAQRKTAVIWYNELGMGHPRVFATVRGKRYLVWEGRPLSREYEGELKRQLSHAMQHYGIVTRALGCCRPHGEQVVCCTTCRMDVFWKTSEVA